MTAKRWVDSPNSSPLTEAVRAAELFLDLMFLLCSHHRMADTDPGTKTALAASPDPDEADDAILSGLIELSAAMARAFQADAIAALQAGDLDRAGKAEAHFSRLFLGI